MAKQRMVFLSPREISNFCAQLTLLIKSGLSASDGVRIMLENTADNHTKSVLAPLYEELEKGMPFFSALEACTVFPQYMIQMVRIGESSGRLDEVLDSLDKYYQRNERVRQSIQSAITYPAIMLGMMMVVIGVLLTQVLPVFARVFAQLGTQMSATAQGLMGMGQWLNVVILVIAGIAICAGLVYVFLRRSANGRIKLAEWYELVFKKLSVRTSASRFAHVVSLMLYSGLDYDESLQFAEDLMESPRSKTMIAKIRDSLGGDIVFSEAIAQSGLFAPMYAGMIKVGQETGAMDETMARVATMLQDDLERQIGRIVSVIEPALVIFLSVVVGAILLSVMLPLLGIMSSI